MQPTVHVLPTLVDTVSRDVMQSITCGKRSGGDHRGVGRKSHNVTCEDLFEVSLFQLRERLRSIDLISDTNGWKGGHVEFVGGVE